MRNAIIILGLLLLFTLPVFAQSINNYSIQKIEINFDIHEDKSVSQSTRFYFESSVSGFVNYTLNENVKNIVISDSVQQLNYSIEKINDGYNLEIFLKDPTSTLTLSYTVNGIIFTSDQVDHFFTEFSFGNEIPYINVTLSLPAGYGLYENSYHPATAVTSSDGKRIILAWNESNVTTGLFSVKFIRLNQQNDMLPFFIIILSGLSVLLVFLYIFFRKRAREEFLIGFRQDEQKAIKYLEEKKMAMQRDLQSEFKFSRAKATRIVMRLEERGLLRKQRYGRTNKLFWLRS